jgi:hypothetical protein
MLIQESQIVDATPCSLYEKIEDPLGICALKTLKVAISASFNSNPFKLADLRDLYVKYWDEIWLASNPSIPDTGPYWEGPTTARIVAHKIYTLLLHYEVLQPIENYELVVQSYTIKGQYALLKERGKVGKVNILVPHTLPYIKTIPPEPTALLRFWHATITHTYHNVRVMHLPLLRGRPSWHDFKDLKQVWNQVIGLVLSYVGDHKFPVAGYQCDSCKTKKCMEAFNAGSYDNPWQRQLAQIRDRRK